MGIVSFKSNSNQKTYLAVSVLGSSLKVNIKYKNISTVEVNKEISEVNITLPKEYKNKDNTQIIELSIQKMYKKIAETEIEYAMEVARHLLSFAPEDYSIKYLNEDYYKCSKSNLIISPDIVRFNREVINTTIIQAFCRLKYRYGSTKYKRMLSKAMNDYEIYYKKSSMLRAIKVS